MEDTGGNKQIAESSSQQRRSFRRRVRNRKYRITSSSEEDHDEKSSEDGGSDESIEDLKTARDLLDGSTVVGKLPIYGFKTPKKRNALMEIATKTPTSVNKSSTKTPHHLRAKLKRDLSKLIRESESSSSESEESRSESPVLISSSDAENDEMEEPKASPQKAATMGTRSSTRIKQNQFVLESDNFFSSHGTVKSLTSNRTLDRLHTPRLAHDELFKLLRTMRLSSCHETAIKAMSDEYTTHFPRWQFYLEQGFNLLLFGLGSKQHIVDRFKATIRTGCPVVLVNGCFPSLTIKDILDAVACDILELESNSNYFEMIDGIRKAMEKADHIKIYVIVNNIDGVMLRNTNSQLLLSLLAKIANIHLVASIDHINAPLLWDVTMLTNFNFTMWDVTTMLPYTNETSYENSLLIQNSDSLALSSMESVFQSLTSTSKCIYMIIVKNQLTNRVNSKYQGMPFKNLYWTCREAFYVSSDLTLRALLTEFFDHKLVQLKRTGDGTEHLLIPIENVLLERFSTTIGAEFHKD